MTLINLIPNGGKIRVAFPTGFVLSSGAASVVNSVRNLNPATPTVTIVSSSVIEITVGSVD